MASSSRPSVRPLHPSVERARRVAKLLDSAITIPVIRKKIGLDPLLGMLPVGGDVISGLLAAYLIYVAHYELRLPREVVIRMGLNTIADLLVGAIPVVGDVADIFWKSNDMNFKLLEEAYQRHGVGARVDKTAKTAGQTVVDVVAEPI